MKRVAVCVLLWRRLSRELVETLDPAANGAPKGLCSPRRAVLAMTTTASPSCPDSLSVVGTMRVQDRDLVWDRDWDWAVTWIQRCEQWPRREVRTRTKALGLPMFSSFTQPAKKDWESSPSGWRRQSDRRTHAQVRIWKAVCWTR